MITTSSLGGRFELSLTFHYYNNLGGIILIKQKCDNDSKITLPLLSAPPQYPWPPLGWGTQMKIKRDPTKSKSAEGSKRG